MINFASQPVSVPVSMIDTLADELIMVCVFCDCETTDPYCPECEEYKGLMTVEDWQDYTGEVWQ